MQAAVNDSGNRLDQGSGRSDQTESDPFSSKRRSGCVRTRHPIIAFRTLPSTPRSSATARVRSRRRQGLMTGRPARLLSGGKSSSTDPATAAHFPEVQRWPYV